MKGANAAFMKQKERFLANNLLVMEGSLQNSVFSKVMTREDIPSQHGVKEEHFADTFELDIVKSPKLYDEVGAKTGKKPDVYAVNVMERFVGKDKTKQKLRKVTTNTNKLISYYLPWSPQRTWTVDLPHDDAEYFFTATLNGCTVAVEPMGAFTRVTHANFTGGDTKIDQPLIETELDKQHTAGRVAVNKDMYTNAPKKDLALGQGKVLDYRCTVFGFLKGGAWEFYYQSYKSYQYLDAIKHKTFTNAILRDRGVRLV